MLRSGRFGRAGLVAVLVLILPFVVFSGCSKDKSTTPSNRAPVINSVTAVPNSVSPGGTSVITAVATDQDGDQLTYAWTAPFGSVVPGGSVATWTLPTTAGAYTITVTASDGDLTSQPLTAGVTVTQPAIVTRISGTLTLAPGQSGDLSNTRVGIYPSYGEFLGNLPSLFVGAVGTGATATYVLDNVPPGNYYLDAWKDVNNNGIIDYGSNDLYGWYTTGVYPGGDATMFAIAQGQTKVLNMQMVVLAP